MFVVGEIRIADIREGKSLRLMTDNHQKIRRTSVNWSTVLIARRATLEKLAGLSKPEKKKDNEPNAKKDRRGLNIANVSEFYRKCFLTCRDMESAKKFKSEINSALADSGGVFWEDVKDSQLQAFLRDMTREFFLDNGQVKKAVTIVGRQSITGKIEEHNPEDDVYVFSDKVQVCLMMTLKF